MILLFRKGCSLLRRAGSTFPGVKAHTLVSPTPSDVLERKGKQEGELHQRGCGKQAETKWANYQTFCRGCDTGSVVQFVCVPAISAVA